MVIFDPFLGSGTTCVAAKQTNRNFIGFEISEKYYKIANDRINGIDQNGQLDLLSLIDDEGELYEH